MLEQGCTEWVRKKDEVEKLNLTLIDFCWVWPGTQLGNIQCDRRKGKKWHEMMNPSGRTPYDGSAWRRSFARKQELIVRDPTSSSGPLGQRIQQEEIEDLVYPCRIEDGCTLT